MSGLSDFFLGNQTKMKSYNKDSLKSLMGLLNGGGLDQNSTFGAGNSYLQNLLSGAPGAFQAFEAPYMQQFQQQIAPGIAERFAGLGTGGGASSSSGLQNSLAQAGQNLSTNLAGLRGNLQLQALPQALNYSQQPLQNILQAAGLIPQQYYEIPGQEGLVHGVSKAFANGLGQGAGGAGTGGFGGGGGFGGFGSGLSGLFGGGGFGGGSGGANFYDQQFRQTGVPGF